MTETAAGGEEAMGKVASTSYSVILMDIRMAGMDGLEAARRIRAHPTGRTVPIIALSASASHRTQAACMDAGMNDYLSKPLDMQRLIQRIAHWVGREANREVAPPENGERDANVALREQEGRNPSRYSIQKRRWLFLTTTTGFTGGC